MKDWKQAWYLAKFELKASKWMFLLLLLFTFFMLFFFVTVLDTGVEKRTAGFDFFFILMFSSTMMIWWKPKDFQINKVGGDVFASPSLVMLNHLAIKKDVIIKSRFFVHFVYSFPYQLILLLCLYPLTPALQSVLTLNDYIVFSIIWLSFSFYVGYLFASSEIGGKSKLSATLAGILILGIVIVTLFLFSLIQLITGYTIFYWTIIIAQNWPLASSLISIILAILGINYWLHYARKGMDKIDYL
ncbi:hypothetical protein [Lentibacillus daqui]|uniref:hypothetical protein n=1 Tax=Lentibacillus daqui TaxID=2911514 RepID=UPI0022B0BFC6|nr:hypothetical protein [Lentibacillus daqui]